MKTFLMNTATAVALMLAVGSTASAKSTEDERQERINAVTIQLREFEARDSGQIVTTELGTAEAWLKEAQASANKKRRKAKDFHRHIARVEAMMVLVEALLEEDTARTQAAEAEAKASALEAKVRDAAAKADALETRQAELEKELTP